MFSLINASQPKKLADFVPNPNTKYAMDWNDYHDHDTLNEFIGECVADNNF